jgi:hypothetical protein
MPPYRNPVTMEKLLEFRRTQKSWTACAKEFGNVSRKSLRSWAIRNGYVEPLPRISDTQLRNIIPEFCRDYDGARGEIQLEGFIVSRGFSVTQKVLRNTIKSLPMYDDARKQRKYRNKVPRQHYYAPGIGWLWHIDTHFKLARWGFIFVGVIDGGSRELICVDIELDKTSHSILKSVLASDGFKKYGVPKTLSMDRGTENTPILFLFAPITPLAAPPLTLLKEEEVALAFVALPSSYNGLLALLRNFSFFESISLDMKASLFERGTGSKPAAGSGAGATFR